MGDHYIPQYYLRGFAGDTDRYVWVFDKETSKEFQSNTINVAHEQGFYNPEVEAYLANSIEAPGNAVLRKIRELQPISAEDK